MTSSMAAMLLVPLILIVPAGLGMFDVSRHPDTRTLTPETWMVICAMGNLIGLAAYLVFGRSQVR